MLIHLPVVSRLRLLGAMSSLHHASNFVQEQLYVLPVYYETDNL
jgi:hypothetical protein